MGNHDVEETITCVFINTCCISLLAAVCNKPRLNILNICQSVRHFKPQTVGKSCCVKVNHPRTALPNIEQSHAHTSKFKTHSKMWRERVLAAPARRWRICCLRPGLDEGDPGSNQLRQTSLLRVTPRKFWVLGENQVIVLNKMGGDILKYRL